MNKYLVVLISALFLSACGPAKQDNLMVTEVGVIQAKVGEEYLLNTEEGIVNITSNKVNLDNYLKKNVTVKGMFSGSTLYVDEIK